MQVPSYILVKNSSNQIAAYISPNDGLKDCFINTVLNGESILEFYLPPSCIKLDKLTPECKIIADNKEFTILKEDAIDVVRDEKNTLWAKVMAVESWGILDTKYPEPYINNDTTLTDPADLTVTIVGGGSDLSGGRYAVGSAAHALYALLSGTGWTLGTVDVTGTYDLETEKDNILENIKQVKSIWGGNLVWDSINKTVSLRDETLWQNYTGFQVRYKKNLKHITRTQSNKIITRLYPFGKDFLDIASVNSGVKYIENHSYTSNTYVVTYENQDIDDASELLTKATEVLAQNCQPRYLYKIGLVDLRTLPGWSHEDFWLGDMVDVIDDGLETNIKARIIRHRYEVFAPWNCELDIGDPQDRLTEKLKASFDTSSTITNASNSKSQLSGSYIQSLSADKLTVGTIDASKITVKNINASNITTGSLSADRISGGTISGVTINVSTDATIGNNIYIGSQTSQTNKGIYFYNSNGSCKITLNSNSDIIFNCDIGSMNFTTKYTFKFTSTDTVGGDEFIVNVPYYIVFKTGSTGGVYINDSSVAANEVATKGWVTSAFTQTSGRATRIRWDGTDYRLDYWNGSSWTNAGKLTLS